MAKKNKKEYEDDFDREYDEYDDYDEKYSDYDDYDNDEYDDDEDDYEESFEERAAYRHKRAVRNRILAFVTVIILLAAISAGIVYGVNRLLALNSSRQQTIELQKQLQELEEMENEKKAIEAPE